MQPILHDNIAQQKLPNPGMNYHHCVLTSATSLGPAAFHFGQAVVARAGCGGATQDLLGCMRAAPLEDLFVSAGQWNCSTEECPPLAPVMPFG